MLAFAKSIVETVPYPMLVLAADERIVAANSVYYRTFASSAAETLGRPLAEVNGKIWDRPELRSLLREVVSQGRTFDGFEVAQEAPPHRSMILGARRVTRDDNGAPMVLLSIEDRTKWQQAHHALQEQNAGLEAMVAERTRELETANRELLAANRELAAVNRELEAFCYSVSHDLRAPLRAIDGFSLELLQSYAGQFDEKGQHYLRRVRAGVQRMGQLIDDLLTLSRVSRDEIIRARVNLSMLAESVVAELRQLEPQRDVNFLVEPDLSANCDPRLARVLLENLLGNAWKFTSKKTTARIEFLSTESTGCKAFVVRDDGAGFDPAYKGRLFGAFQRLHSDREFPGTGIGLATVQRIVRRHGGETWAEGAVDRGAALYFTLPDSG